MLVELVRVLTGDGVRLDGVLQAPPDGVDRSGPSLPIDAILSIHGTGGNFYSSTMFVSIAERFTTIGVAVLRVNTRGHDGISTAMTRHGGRRLGAAFEVVDDCRHDLAAWIEWLVDRGYRRIALVGHSSGAVKSIYTMALEPNDAVTRLVAISPPRLSHRWFQQRADADQFRDAYSQANRLVEAGRPNELLEVSFPLPMIISAGGYVDKYGPAERYNVLDYLPKVPCPVLAVFGGQEIRDNLAFQELPDAIGSLKARSAPIEVTVIPGADHFYTGRLSPLVDLLESWMTGPGNSPGPIQRPEAP